MLVKLEFTSQNLHQRIGAQQLLPLKSYNYLNKYTARSDNYQVAEVPAKIFG
ncbi:hypothetical protein PBAL39_14359 [Pedobacter sp. BAL39]|nr:hypothetical protein PBAL39_14359 [Pedobacter sp. BAL39]